MKRTILTILITIMLIAGMCGIIYYIDYNQPANKYSRQVSKILNNHFSNPTELDSTIEDLEQIRNRVLKERQNEDIDVYESRLLYTKNIINNL